MSTSCNFAQQKKSKVNKRFFPKRGAQTQQVDRIQFMKGTTLVEVYKPREVLAVCQADTKSKYSETDTTPLLMEKSIHKLWGNFAETTYSRNFQNRKTELSTSTPKWMRIMLQRTRHDFCY